MDAYCISLKKNKEKWPELIEKIRKNGFENIEIFEAVNGKELKPSHLLSVWSLYNLTKNVERKEHAQLGSWGAVGCYLSHALIWERMVEKNTQKCIIFEDDVKFYSNFKEEFEKVTPFIPKDADVVFLDLLWCENKINVNKHVKKINGQFFGTHAYIITLEAAKKFLSKILPIEIQIDSYMSYFSLENNMNMYTLKNICTQKIHMSSIQQPCVICDLTSKKFKLYIYLVLFLIMILITCLVFFSTRC